MKLFYALLGTETNMFTNIPTRYEDFFKEREGGHLSECFDHVKEIGAREGWSVVTGMNGFAAPAGRTVASDYLRLKRELLAEVEAAMPLDAVLLSMHGAMLAMGCDDCEGDIIADIRKLVGPKASIGVHLDPHAHLTDTLMDNADILVFYKEWPHTDTVETVRQACELTLATAEGKVQPQKSLFDPYMIDSYSTIKEPMQSLVEEMRAMEGKDNVLSISIVHGFRYADIPAMGSKVLVITDNAPAQGEKIAADIGQRIIANRGKNGPDYIRLDEGLDLLKRALQNNEKLPIVVADCGDSPAGGAPGDATYLLKGLLDRQITDVALCYLWDPMAVDIAFRAGEGAELPLRIGGKCGQLSGDPLDLDVKVIKILPNFVLEVDSSKVRKIDGRRTPIGDIAVVRANGIDIALTRYRAVAYHWLNFEAIGLGPKQRKVMVVKSAGGYAAGFKEVAGQFLNISVPGAADRHACENLEYKHISHPLWPFDTAHLTDPELGDA